MKNDVKLRDDILSELAYEPSIDAAQIGVTAHNGVVTLSGRVSSFGQKRAAEDAARRVKGVRAVAEDIVIKSADSKLKNDSEIAEVVANGLKWNHALPKDTIDVTVENACVYLDGQVNTNYQKWIAKNTAEMSEGVNFVVDRLDVKTSVNTSDIKAQIQSALERSARLDGQTVEVTTKDHEVTLKGKVHSWAEVHEAKHTAMRAPGVESVKNELVVV